MYELKKHHGRWMLLLVLLSLAALGRASASDNLDLSAHKKEFAKPASIPFPADNPYSADKVALGKMLFFDPRLSEHQTLSCASCHNPSFGWEGASALSVGSQNVALGRHSPTVINLAWTDQFFWDGRAASLEDQAMGPIQSQMEMNMKLGDLVGRLNKVPGYVALFDAVFGEPISSENIAKAIATFERTLISDNSPFDRWLAGDEAAMNTDAVAGFELFVGKAQCSGCHSGWNFTDNQFHDIGLASDDVGRMALDDSNGKNLHAFKTPGLRNIASRAPYMHDGSLPNLDSVIAHYIGGGINRPSRSDKMEAVMLTGEEMQQLKAFLHALTGDDQPMSLPSLPL